MDITMAKLDSHKARLVGNPWNGQKARNKRPGPIHALARNNLGSVCSAQTVAAVYYCAKCRLFALNIKRKVDAKQSKKLSIENWHLPRVISHKNSTAIYLCACVCRICIVWKEIWIPYKHLLPVLFAAYCLLLAPEMPVGSLQTQFFPIPFRAACRHSVLRFSWLLMLRRSIGGRANLDPFLGVQHLRFNKTELPSCPGTATATTHA